MNREQAKQWLPIIQAFADGADVQYLCGDEWCDASEPSFTRYDTYRIKPKPRESWLVYSKSTGMLIAWCDNKAECDKWLVSWGDRYVVHMREVTK